MYYYIVSYVNLSLWPIFYTFIIIVPGFYLLNWCFADIYQVKKYRSKGHVWKSIQSNKAIPYDNHCFVCDKLMLPAVGQFCERCSLSTCRNCQKIAEKKKGCRVLSSSINEPFYHHWTKVGTTSEDLNTLSEEAGDDYFCCWCHRIQHCLDSNAIKEEVCDFGSMKNLIIPPTNVKVSRTGGITINPPDWNDWQPLIVIGNPISGGGEGDEILSLFRGFLNPIQVIRLSKKSLRSDFQWIPPQSKIIVAGGDGSVSAVLSAIANSKKKEFPAVGVLPLGTGNDLSRVLGWGGTCPNPVNPLTIIKDVKKAKSDTLDRWCVQIGRRQLYAYNYISIGVDARVALDFHRARLHPLYVRGSQWMNYLIYLCLGTQQVLSQDCHELEKMLEVTVDGELIELPPLQALLLLNIPSWGAGVDVWNAGADSTIPNQSYNDGRLEMLGINSSFHIAKLQIGMSQPNRIGQASNIKIKLKGFAPMQVDGEPWEQVPCEILVQKVGTVSVLCRADN